jgi:hypothetical protein
VSSDPHSLLSPFSLFSLQRRPHLKDHPHRFLDAPFDSPTSPPLDFGESRLVVTMRLCALGRGGAGRGGGGRGGGVGLSKPLLPRRY